MVKSITEILTAYHNAYVFYAMRVNTIAYVDCATRVNTIARYPQ